MMYDAFVLGKKSSGVGVACLPGTVVKTPTVAVADGKATIQCATADAVIYYTTNGSDPRYSTDAQLYTAPVALTSGDELRVYAAKTDMFWSAVAEHDMA